MVDQYLQHLMALIGSNRVFASYEFMKNLPPNTPIPNKHNLFSELESKVNRAREYTRDINRLLKKAAYPKALENLKKAKQLVPDFPNIQNDIDFISGTIANLQQSLSDAEQAAMRGEQKKVREYLDTAHKIDVSNIAISRINKKLQKSMRKRRVRNILLTAMVILTPCLYCGYEQFSFMESNSQWNKAQSYIARHDYQLAKSEMEKVENRLNNVRLLNQVEKVKLLECVTNMIESTRFQQGLLGKVLHNGHFINLTSKQQLDQIASLSFQAKESMAEKKLSDALTSYQTALNVALEDEDFHQTVIEELQKSILQIRDERYAQYEEEGRASFRTIVGQADLLFKERRWSEAMDAYDQALRFAQDNRVSDYDVVTRISTARHKSEMKNCLDEAHALLAGHKNVEAHNIFERIIALSEENDVADFAATSIAKEMIAQIDKDIFLSKINNLEEKAGKLWVEKKYDDALAYYHEMLAELADHSTEIHGNWAEREKMVKIAMAKIYEEQVVTTQHRYLLTAYQNILRKTFNLSTNIHLKQPKVVFLKDENNALIYKVSALGTKSSYSSAPHTKYEVDYKFDKGTESWDLNGSPTS